MLGYWGFSTLCSLPRDAESVYTGADLDKSNSRRNIVEETVTIRGGLEVAYSPSPLLARSTNDLKSNLSRK